MEKHEQVEQQSAAQPKLGILLSVLVLVLAAFMSVLDNTIVNVSIPKMMAVFGVGTTDIQWVVTAYSLVVGALVPITGYLGDRFGYKRIFLYSVILFTLGSALCGMAWSNRAMIIFRIIQAIGGGAIMPISMAMMFRMFPPERRGFSMGIFGIAIMFAPAFGPTLGGYITEYMDWRLIFYINVPIGIIDIILASIILEETRPAAGRKFDFWGFLTSSAGLASLLYGLGIVADKGWSDIEVISYITFGLVCLALFTWIELTIEEPMIDLRLMKNGLFSLSLAITSIASIILFASLFLLPVFLQNVSGLSALDTGLVLLPQGIAAGIMMPISGFLFDKIGAKWLAVVGLTITAYGYFLMQSLDVTTAYSTISAWLIIRAIGIGGVMMPVTTAGMNTVPPPKVGQATALTNAIRQVSASLGIAWLSTLFSQRVTFHMAVGAEQVNESSVAAMQTLAQAKAAFMSSGQSVQQAAQSALSYIGQQVQLSAIVRGMDDVFWVITIVTLLAIFLAFFMKDVRKKGEKPQAVIAE
ncbi:MFS transporter [Collibacillus ludicampi]|uniref:MFS transporter n=1 Tax=Collibacillus ludicampi TaxID=2771369 RepID=A0AAV4LC42_9BACL|nr:DHA2 family efflux MFS transporter permease subunit [Collibacillus ludicampi]GIM45366.1 MFS transporter [Collibacillus ludicampi]